MSAQTLEPPSPRVPSTDSWLELQPTVRVTEGPAVSVAQGNAVAPTD